MMGVRGEGPPMIVTVGNKVLLVDTFTAANGTQITSRAPDVGSTPTTWFGAASLSTIQSNSAQFNNGGVFYTASRPYTSIYWEYINAAASNNNTAFYQDAAPNVATQFYAIRILDNNLLFIDSTVGTVAWTTGTAAGTWTSGTCLLTPTAAGITLVVTDNSLGLRNFTYVGAMRNSVGAVWVALCDNKGTPSHDNLIVYG